MKMWIISDIIVTKAQLNMKLDIQIIIMSKVVLKTCLGPLFVIDAFMSNEQGRV